MMTSDETTNCFICQKHRGELPIPGGLIYEDDLLAVCHIQNLEGDMPAFTQVPAELAVVEA